MAAAAVPSAWQGRIRVAADRPAASRALLVLTAYWARLHRRLALQVATVQQATAPRKTTARAAPQARRALLARKTRSHAHQVAAASQAWAHARRATRARSSHTVSVQLVSRAQLARTVSEARARLCSVHLARTPACLPWAARADAHHVRWGTTALLVLSLRRRAGLARMRAWCGWARARRVRPARFSVRTGRLRASYAWAGATARWERVRRWTAPVGLIALHLGRAA